MMIQKKKKISRAVRFFFFVTMEHGIDFFALVLFPFPMCTCYDGEYLHRVYSAKLAKSREARGPSMEHRWDQSLVKKKTTQKATTYQFERHDSVTAATVRK